MKEPLLSILIPVYGVERWIERCAVSLFEQDYENIEYIFVNDCTKDNSIGILNDVIARYPNRAAQVRILHHEKNRGLAAARNTAFDAASGEYIRIVDSDDFIPSNSCSLLVNAILATNSDVVIGGYRTLLPEGRETVSLPSPVNERTLKKRLCGIIPPAMWACIFTRRLFVENGFRWVEGINLSEDFMMMNRLLLIAKAHIIGDVVYNYDLTQTRDFSIIYAGHIRQMTQSALEVWKYYQSTVFFSKYRKILELSLINPLREEHKSKIKDGYVWSDYYMVEPKLSRNTKFLAYLLRNDFLFLFGDFAYRLYRASLFFSSNVQDD